jgi:hypothetical protein
LVGSFHFIPPDSSQFTGLEAVNDMSMFVHHSKDMLWIYKYYISTIQILLDIDNYNY